MGTAVAAPLVLIADDSPELRELFVTFLQRTGIRVESTGNGADALDRCTALQPDAVVLDLSLPGLSGLGVCRRLKADRRTEGIRVIVLTGRAESGRAAKRRGCDAFLVKPCLPEDLLAAIQAALPMPAASRRASREATPLPSAV
jgi:two-component system cell cycle response regulator DivK